MVGVLDSSNAVWLTALLCPLAALVPGQLSSSTSTARHPTHPCFSHPSTHPPSAHPFASPQNYFYYNCLTGECACVCNVAVEGAF